MHIEHVAFWVRDLEGAKGFYVKYFEGEAGPVYNNPTKNFTSYFISFETGARLELMHNPNIHSPLDQKECLGITHLAFSVGSKAKVDHITNRLAKDGFRIVGKPRTTGDGYYESVVLDTENNRIEITI